MGERWCTVRAWPTLPDAASRSWTLQGLSAPVGGMAGRIPLVANRRPPLLQTNGIAPQESASEQTEESVDLRWLNALEVRRILPADAFGADTSGCVVCGGGSGEVKQVKAEWQATPERPSLSLVLALLEAKIMSLEVRRLVLAGGAEAFARRGHKGSGSRSLVCLILLASRERGGQRAQVRDWTALFSRVSRARPSAGSRRRSYIRPTRATLVHRLTTRRRTRSSPLPLECGMCRSRRSQ